jgi:hypothetical protein
LKFSINSTAFKAGEEFYLQKKGTAMGKSYSPIVAELYMQFYESIALESCEQKPKLWVRYVDDTFVIWPFGAESLPEFLNHLNSVPGMESIQFTYEMEIDSTLPFLDVLVRRKGLMFETTVYRKPTNTGLFIRKSSLHHPSHKLSAISALTHRAKVVCSSKQLLYEELLLIRNQFMANGFLDKEISRTINKTLFKVHEADKEPGRGYESQRVKIPYLGPVSHGLARLLHKFQIQTISAPFRTLRQLISKPKCFLEDKEKKNVVYQLNCDCGEIYIGETARTSATRWKEHKSEWERAVQLKQSSENWTEREESALKSSFKKHLDHSPNFQGSVLRNFRYEPDRIISEAVFIKRAKLQGASTILNSNSGREIDPVFDSIIGNLPKLTIPVINNGFDGD